MAFSYFLRGRGSYAAGSIEAVARPWLSPRIAPE